MKPLRLALALALTTALASAAPSPKTKPLDSCDAIDAKSTNLYEVAAKIIQIKDPKPQKALELTFDYAKPGAYPGYIKKFQQGLIDPKKYSAIRVVFRSNSETAFQFELYRAVPRKDGKSDLFYFDTQKANADWTELLIPLESFKRAGGKIWKNGVQQDMPGAGEPIDSDDYSKLGALKITSLVHNRGTGTVGHLVFSAIELVEK